VKRGVLQLPDWQAPRFALHALLSGALGVEQAPVVMLHVPVM
jgi:hypothetical protein